MTDRTDHELEDELAIIDGRLRTLEQLVDRYIAGNVPLEQLLDDCDATVGATEAELEREVRRLQQLIIDDVDDAQHCETLCAFICAGPCGGPL